MTFQSSSFDDLNKASAHTSHYTLPQGQMAAASGFEEEPPLLEELGIDPALVVRKSMQVGLLTLNPSFTASLFFCHGVLFNNVSSSFASVHTCRCVLVCEQVLNPLRLDPKLLADGDISGLLVYGAALALCHLLVRELLVGEENGVCFVRLRIFSH
jgi:hypothetical protein